VRIACRPRTGDGNQSNELGCDPIPGGLYDRSRTSSVEKAVKMAGIGRKTAAGRGRRALRDAAGGVGGCGRPGSVHGKKPFFVSATAGTTSSNGFDPLSAIGRVCREQQLWLHVDGAMSGTAAICPEFRRWFAGLELADSYAFNPHKWMFTNFDCDCFYVADRASLIRALSILPEYLRNQASESGAVFDYRDWQVSLGRRFRALKLWFVIRHYGVEGLQWHIRRHVALAQEFAGWVRASKDFELVAPAPLNLVCFAHRDGDDFNKRLLDRLNQSGRIYLTHTVLNGRFTLRFCVGQTNTESRHVRAAWDLIQNEARDALNHK